MKRRPRRVALARGVHCTGVDDDIVFLDVRRGRYSCLAGAADQLRPKGCGIYEAASADLAGELIDAGLMDPDGAGLPAPPVLPPAPRRSALPWRDPAPAPADLGDAATALIDVLSAYRGRTFQSIIASVRDPRIAAQCDPATLAVATRFHRWIPYAPLSGKCFLRAFMLRRLLERRGLSAAWVFGVATWPFLAHCWLQQGDVVLDDTVERVEKYTPILVV